MTSKIKYITIIILSLILSLPANSVVAEISPEFKYLYSEPATLLDFGLYKLNLTLKERMPVGMVLGDGWRVNMSFAGFNPGGNQITIDVLVFPVDKKKKKLPAIICKQIWHKTYSMLIGLDHSAKVDPSTVKEILWSYFRHNTYRVNEAPKDIEDYIAKNFIIRILHMQNNDNRTGCEAPIVGGAIVYTDSESLQ